MMRGQLFDIGPLHPPGPWQSALGAREEGRVGQAFFSSALPGKLSLLSITYQRLFLH